ncbi:MAG TPA: FAD/NAD(P)-binding oxidoreductase, partial [Stackebrandtia sp.]|uniref:NAD(P)/FAD-dependent oxidoreductase n=1 Tax=Stackebrandtia sp. TaxID=2023065 RepID=UPI002D434D7E
MIPDEGSRVVVVGAGPAGLAAAEAAAAHGVGVVLLDAEPRLGGQYSRQAATAPERRRLPDGVEHWPESAVWAVEPNARGHRVHVLSGPADGPGRISRTVETRALVLATGAHDRALPFPGWDLPGVVTAGAAQALAKGQGVAIGRRVVVAGTGPFLLPVAASLLGVGAKVVEVLEANDPVSGWRGEPRAILAGGGKARELVAYATMLARQRIPYRTRRAVVAAHGRDRVEAVTTARLDAEWNVVAGSLRRVEADAVCVGFGFTPQLELAIACGCAMTRHPATPRRSMSSGVVAADGEAPPGRGLGPGGFVAVDIAQSTSVPGVFAAGEITGIGGAALSAAEGTIAGTAAA